MRTVSVAEAKARLSELLKAVESGEDVMITRHGRAIARVSQPVNPKSPIPLERLAARRAAVPPWHEPSAKSLRRLRDAE